VKKIETIVMPMGLDIDFIRERRLKLKLTQGEAAKRAGLESRQYWNDIEKGRRTNFTLVTLERMAEALDTSVKNLVK
jgi:transcriptional regulator with XRE-family HTH domain